MEQLGDLVHQLKNLSKYEILDIIAQLNRELRKNYKDGDIGLEEKKLYNYFTHGLKY